MHLGRHSVELVLTGFTLHRCTDNVGNCFFKNATQGIMVLQLESNCITVDKEEGKERKADQITNVVNEWLPYPNLATSCHTGNSTACSLISQNVFFWLNNDRCIWVC